jgi:hypothetical protein
MDEPMARKFGELAERYDATASMVKVLSEQLAAEREKNENKAREIARIEEAKRKVEAEWNKELAEAGALIRVQKEHTDNLEAQKNPSGLKPFLIGALVGAAVAALVAALTLPRR